MKIPKITSIIRSAIALSSMVGLAAQAQPVISGITPDGSVQFQYAAKLSFIAVDSVAITNFSVQLAGTKPTGETSLKAYSSASGLTITKSGTTNTVTAPLSSNYVYSVTIVATDASGASTTANASFDTIKPAYTWEAEDYDYTANGVSGLFIDNPQTNAYKGLVALDGIDAHNAAGGNADYRPHDPAAGGLATESCGDKPRAQYKNSGLTDYDVGWNNGGNWANYTRRFPAGAYNIFMRGANPNGAQSASAYINYYSITVGQFGVPNTGGWQNFTWVPLKDASGNLVEWDFDGTAQTFNISTSGGSYNANFYMLLPVAAGAQPPDARISGITPDGTSQFQATTQMVFTVTSTLGVKPTDITVQLGETNLAGVGTTKVLLGGSGLTVTGSSTERSVSAPIKSNMVYTVFIQVTDANGNPTSSSLKFDTIAPAYTWEAEDWDYGSGQYITDANWTPGAYRGLDGVVNVDFARPSTGGGSSYGRVGVATEPCSDLTRLSFNGAADYDIGNTGNGNWVNYTRDWPAGVYNIYVRTANGNSGTTTDAGSISLVTSGAGTDTQTTTKLGTFNSPSTGGWQNWSWQPVVDAGGNLYRFTGGSRATLRSTIDNGSVNLGFYLLLPAGVVHTVPFVSDFSPNGSQIYQLTNLATFNVNSAAGITTNGVSVTVDGFKASGLSFSGNANLMTVTLPVTLNAVHTVVTVVTDSFGSSTNTAKFNTFDPVAAYKFEAEDYDYNGGRFIDNPAPNAYAGLNSVDGVDAFSVAGNFTGTHVPYRSSGLNQENASDNLETADHAGIQNYDMGSTTGGNWGNYTRTFPAGVYNIYERAANNGQSSAGSVLEVTGGQGTTSQTTVSLGAFDTMPPTGGWQTYAWTALRDPSGNLVQFTCDGVTPRTLRIVSSGGYNADYFVLVPIDTTQPTVSNLYPDGTLMFQQTNTLSFTVSSTAGISTNAVQLTINGVVVTNLAFTGSSTSWVVTYSGLRIDSPYTATISFSALNGGHFAKSFSFDTHSDSYYTWEAEDWDFTTEAGPGQFFDNPQVGKYMNVASTAGVDFQVMSTTDYGFTYRPNTYPNDTAPNWPFGTPTAGDAARAQFPGTTPENTDYRMIWFTPGSWAHYTRTYPAGTYTVMGRFTEGNGPLPVKLSRVTGGVFGQNETTALLGTFIPPNAGWDTWESVMLTDANGKPAIVKLDGSKTTLRLEGGYNSPDPVNDSINAGFFMLIPVLAPAPELTASVGAGKVAISFATQTGSSYQVMYKHNLSDTTWTPLGSAVTGNGSTQSVSDTLGQSGCFYRVQVLAQP